MAGMLTGDRSVRLEVSGLCQQPISRRSNYSVTVPYQSMSKTMQNISRMGGKVIGIQVGNTKASMETPPQPQAPSAEDPTTAVKNTEAPAKAKSKKGR